MSWSSALCTMYVLSPVGAMRALLPQVSDMLGCAGKSSGERAQPINAAHQSL